jgi:large subunit ribosomal protein L30
MAAIKVKLTRGLAGCPESHRITIRGMGLKKRDSTKLLPDTPATMGMIDKVAYLVAWEKVDAPAPARRPARKKAECGERAAAAKGSR